MSNKVIENYRKMSKIDKFSFWVLLGCFTVITIGCVGIILRGMDILEGNIEPFYTYEEFQGLFIMLVGIWTWRIGVSILFSNNNKMEKLQKKIKELEEKVKHLEEKS